MSQWLGDSQSAEKESDADDGEQGEDDSAAEAFAQVVAKALPDSHTGDDEQRECDEDVGVVGTVT